MTTEQVCLEKDYAKVNIRNYVPQKYSGPNKKMAPVVPPKPTTYTNEALSLPISECIVDNDFSFTPSPEDLFLPPPPPQEVLSYSPPPNQSFPLPPPPPELLYSHIKKQTFPPPPPPPPEDLMPPPLPSSAYGAAASVGKPQQAPYSGPGYKSTPPGPYPQGPSPYAQALAKAGNSPRTNDEPIYQTTGSLQRGQRNPAPQAGGYSSPGGYATPVNQTFVKSSSNQPTTHPDREGKEAEVDALTNLLVKSMDVSNEVEICGKCGDRIVGENNGCTAMDQVFHITCFVCCVCGIQLKGKPFYAMEGKPYCEEDYMNTLEKCSVCQKPITKRILRATGKPYHPQCFTCVVCGKSLDGIPFTVDAANQIHCIEDFHKKFAPRCCVCKQPIMPDPGQEKTIRIVAMDKSFHINCYKCEDCGLVLSSESDGRGCYPLDDHILCKTCNTKRVQALFSRMSTEL